jgi:hypothetical protein
LVTFSVGKNEGVEVDDSFILLAVVAAFACAAIGGWIGNRKHAGGAGFLLGLLLGPIGVVVAAMLDNRLRCPKCANRIDDQIKLCPVCHATLNWHRDNSSQVPIEDIGLADLARKTAGHTGGWLIELAEPDEETSAQANSPNSKKPSANLSVLKKATPIESQAEMNADQIWDSLPAFPSEAQATASVPLCKRCHAVLTKKTETLNRLCTLCAATVAAKVAEDEALEALLARPAQAPPVVRQRKLH